MATITLPKLGIPHNNCATSARIEGGEYPRYQITDMPHPCCQVDEVFVVHFPRGVSDSFPAGPNEFESTQSAKLSPVPEPFSAGRSYGVDLAN